MNQFQDKHCKPGDDTNIAGIYFSHEVSDFSETIYPIWISNKALARYCQNSLIGLQGSQSGNVAKCKIVLSNKGDIAM